MSEIVREMERLASDEVDPESNHAKADDLLLEAMRQFAKGSGYSLEATRITQAFNALKKWYA